jgi:hypothetical protein
MLKNLPPAITAYLTANARLDPDGMLAPFAPTAVVKDEALEHRGQAEIADWIRAATLDVRAIFTPDAWRRDADAIVVEGLTAGDFPGSPLRFSFRFQLAGDAISALEIA